MPDDAVRAPERAFLHALAKKYLVGAAGAKGCNELGPTGGLCKKDALKQTTLELLEQVVLQDAKVEHAGESGAIRATAPAIVDLDLTGNPLAGWQEVLGIASQLDHLRFYSLVRVPLPPPTPTLPSPEAIGTSFRALRTLVLNETGLTFASACAICVHLPQLEELQLGDHDIDLASAVTAGGWPYPRALASTFPALRTLLLENARVTRWSDAWALRLLPRLETLSLNKNPIDTVEYVLPDDGGADGGAAAGVGAVGSAPDAAPDAAGEEPLPFAQLKHLFMLESHLSDWRHVDQFDRFPALREIRCGPLWPAPAVAPAPAPATPLPCPAAAAAPPRAAAPLLPSCLSELGWAHHATAGTRRHLESSAASPAIDPDSERTRSHPNPKPASHKLTSKPGVPRACARARPPLRRPAPRRLQDAPVVRGIGASVARQILIARVGKITALNGAAVNRREREAAERYYLRHSIEHYPEELPEPLMVRARARAQWRSCDGFAAGFPAPRAAAALTAVCPRPPRRGRRAAGSAGGRE